MLQPYYHQRFVRTDHDNYDVAHGPPNTSNSPKRPTILWRPENDKPATEVTIPLEAK